MLEKVEMIKNRPRCQHVTSLGEFGSCQCKRYAKPGFNLCTSHGWIYRYFIQFTWQEEAGDHWKNKTKAVWPILFHSYQAAWDHLMATPHFKNLPSRRKLSCCVEATKKRFPSPHLKEIST